MTGTGALQAVNVSRVFDGLVAVKDANLTVNKGQIVALIGPNGAGKTTLLNCLAGNDSPTHGSIELDGISINQWPSHKRANAGVRRTFQHARPFISLSLLENTMIPLMRTPQYNFFDGVLRTRRYRIRESEMREEAYQSLSRVGLASYAKEKPGKLSAGQQRLAEVARAYVGVPRFLLLDEPTSGLDTNEAQVLFDLLAEFQSEGLGIVLVEHRIRTAVQIADFIVVMDQGRVVSSGTPDEVRNAKTVIDAYLGGSSETE